MYGILCFICVVYYDDGVKEEGDECTKGPNTLVSRNGVSKYSRSPRSISNNLHLG